MRKVYEREQRPVCVIGFNRRVQWSDVFENNPKITRDNPGGSPTIKNAGGCRPYIHAKTITRWYFKEWDIAPGEIYLTDEEKRFAAPYRGKILVEPNTKVLDGNKAWIFDRWQSLVDSFGADRFVQVGPGGTRNLGGVNRVETTFRQGMAVLSVCAAYVGPEGALHHAAAALDVPAVVLWSEFISPNFTGYTFQRNLRHAGEYCGQRLPCRGCKAAMEAITVDEVLANLGEVLAEAPRRLAA